MTDEELADCIIPMDRTLEKLGTVELDDNRFTAFINGNPSRTGYRVVRIESDFRAGEGINTRDAAFTGSTAEGYSSEQDILKAGILFRPK